MASHGVSRTRFRVRLLLVLLAICTVGNFFPDAARALPTLPTPPTVTPVKDVTGVLGAVTPVAGVQQTLTAAGQVVEAVKGLGPAVLGVAAPDVQGQVAAIQAAIASIQADILAVDPAGVQGDVMAQVSAIEGQVLGLALSTGLTSGLSLAQNVLSPVCAVAAIPTSFASGVGVDLSRLYKAASPLIEQTDARTDTLIKNVYNTVYADILTLLGANATTAAVPALLTLLQFNWTTTYEKPDGTRIVKTMPGLINIPTPIDVDNSGTFDVCAMAGYALDPSGAIIMKQTITKMPLAKAVLPLKIEAPMVLGLLTVGYDTTKQATYDTDPTAADNSQSTMPISYSATTTYASALSKFDTAVAVHRGTTLTLPPVKATAQIPALPTVMPLTEPAATPKLTQELCLLSCSTLALINRYDNEANELHVATPTPAAAAQNLSFTSSARGDLYRLNYALLGGLAGLQTKVAPAPTALTYQTSTTAGTYSNSPHAATDKGSLKLVSNIPVKFDNSAQALLGFPASCTLRSADVHVTGSLLRMSATPSSATAPGKVWVDTGDQPISGCVGYASSATGIPAATFVDGSKANGRDATYHSTTAPLLPDTKTGTVSCPSGASFTLGSIAATGVVCPVNPQITAGPTITGEPVVESPLTANSTWNPVADTPTVANSPTLSYQWSKCDNAGNLCNPVAGATNKTYLPVYPDDIGSTFRVTIKGMNADGSLTSAPSAATAPIADQTVAPVNTVFPTITGVAGTGHTLTAHSAKSTDWSQGVSGPLTYQWQKCDAAGANCADISGATDSTYAVAYPTDLDSTIQVVVTATNHVGSTAATSAQQRIQPAPINTSIGSIVRCLNAACTSSAAIPGSPFTGDKLKVTDGTWAAGTQTALAYQWNRCDETGANCTPIAGATTNRYTVSKTDDLGKTLTATVTATNNNLDDTAAPVKTSVDTAATQVVTPAKPAVQSAPVVDGIVNSVVGSGHDTTYLGGSFDTAGPGVGGAGAEVLAAGATQGSVVNGAAVTGGVVKSITSDLVSGYFIGGNFTKVQGVSCPAFAHITSAGALDPLYCNLGGIAGDVHAVNVVNATYLSPTTTYYKVAVGGLFTAGGHSNYMLVDATSKALSFDPLGDPNGAVNAIAGHGTVFTLSGTVSQQGKIYIGGDFTKIGSTPANHLARFNWAGTQAAPTINLDTTYTPSVCTGAPVSGACPTSSVMSIQIVGAGLLTAPTSILVGGSFDGAYKAADAPTARNNAAAFSPTAPGAVLAWNPNTNGVVNAISVGTAPTASVPGTVFLGGVFTHAGAASPGGVDVTNLVAFGLTSAGGNSTTTGQLNSSPSTVWAPSGIDGAVNAISAVSSASSSYIAVGGAFKHAQGSTAHRIALYVNAASASTAAAALQPLTAHAGNDVYSLARDASSRLLAGGAFKVLGGKVRNNVAEIGTANGVTSFVADTDGPVTAVGANSDNVYLAGGFTKVNGTNRAGLGAVKQSDNSVTSWAPSINSGGVVNALTANDSAVYAGGSFTDIGGFARANLAAIDPVSGFSSSWNPGVAGTVKSIVISGGNVLVGGSFSNAGGAARSNAAAIDAGSGNATSWAPNPDGVVNGIAVDSDSGAIFLGGSFSNAGGAARANIAKVDNGVGNAAAWQADTDGAVNALVVFSGNLYITGAYTTTGGNAFGSLSGVDANTGEVLDWQPTPSAVIRSMSLTSSGLIALGGDFVTFNPPVTATNTSPVFSYRPGFALLG